MRAVRVYTTKFHACQLGEVTMLSVPAEDNGYQSIKLTKEQVEALGLKSGVRGKELFGHVARHQIVRDGELAEFVTVFTSGREKIIL